MDIQTVLIITLGIAVAAERTAEVVKPVYLKAKNEILRRNDTECTPREKTIMTIILAPALSLIAGKLGLEVTVPGITVSPIVIQIALGLFASLGSNVIHALLNIVVALKDNAESIVGLVKQKLEETKAAIALIRTSGKDE